MGQQRVESLALRSSPRPEGRYPQEPPQCVTPRTGAAVVAPRQRGDALVLAYLNAALARPNVSDLPASVFTVEVNGIPTIAFQTKWAADAERIAFAWAAQHSHQIRTRGSHGTELPPVIKVRLARSDERIVIDQGAQSEFYEDVRIVYLIEFSS